MKTILTLSFVFASLIMTAQNRAQTMLLIPQNFTLSPNQKISSSGKSFCLEIQNSAPLWDANYSIEMLKKARVVVGNRTPISLFEAQQQGILNLVNNDSLEFEYYFVRGSKYQNEKITIEMSDKLSDNIIAPKGAKVDVSYFRDILNYDKSSIISADFQGDLWFYQLKKDLFKQANPKFELNSPRKIHAKKTDEFIENIKRVLEDNIYCKPTDAELCFSKENSPTVSFSFTCKYIDITVSTDGEVSLSNTIGNKYISLTEEKTFKLHDSFKKDVKVDESENPCSWEKICFNINKSDNFPKPIIPDCPIIDAVFNNKISLSNEVSGKTITLSFN